MFLFCNRIKQLNLSQPTRGAKSLFYDMISSQVAFIRMKWDKLDLKNAVMVHLFLNSEVLVPKLPTAWHVHMVSVVFDLGKLHHSSIKIYFG